MWVVDTCVLIDIAEGDPVFGASSARLLDRKRSEGLIVCPISYVELSVVCHGDTIGQNLFLSGLAVEWNEHWTMRDTLVAHSAWHRQVAGKRSGHTSKRPVADIQIGAFAARFTGLLTRNPSDFRYAFPNLVIETP